jgi:hypothetical protein
MKTATVSMETVSVDSLQHALSRQRAREQAQTDLRVCNEALAQCQARPQPTFAQEIRTCFVHLDFEGLPPKERAALLAYPTTFALSGPQLQTLRAAAGMLLATSSDFQRLLRVLREEPRVGAGVPGVRGNCS